MVCTKRDWESQQIGALADGFQAFVSLKQGEAQAIANAWLIASAPELLEQLLHAYACIEDLRQYLVEPSNPRMEVNQTLNEMAHVIAKATLGTK